MPLLIREKKLDRAEKIQLVISYVLQVIVLSAIVIFLVRGDWLNAFASLGIFLSMLLPKIIRKSYHVRLPVEMDFVVIVFLFAALFLGEIQAFYTLFPWWDTVLHTTSGLLLGVFAYLLVYIMNEEKNVRIKMNPAFVALFAFAFGVMIGGVWEIFEFSMDNLFGFNMQKSGLVDTMWDLILATVGTAVIAILGFFYSRKGDSLIFDRIVHKFVERNPKIFRKRQKQT